MATKRPTIKDTNRAYVALYKIVLQNRDWEEFKTQHIVQIVNFGRYKNIDCAVEVRDKTGALAVLGDSIPNRITYSEFIDPVRVTWTWQYSDGEKTWREVDSR